MKKLLHFIFAISTPAIFLVFASCGELFGDSTDPDGDGSNGKSDSDTSLKWEFVEEDGTLTISGKGGIPEENAPWAEHLGQIVNVVIEDGIEDIAAGAFSPYHGNNYAALKTIEIASSVKGIGRMAFQGCTHLETVTLGRGLLHIGDNVFDECTALASIAIPNTVTTIGSGVFLKCAALESIAIPNSVTEMGPGVFWDCTALESVSLPNNMEYVHRGTFYGCTSLERVTIPNSVTTILQHAFEGCTGLISATIGSGVAIIEGDAFKDCAALADVTIMATTPPEVFSNNFIYNENDTLRVPRGCLAAYSSFEGYHFTRVVEQ